MKIHLYLYLFIILSLFETKAQENFCGQVVDEVTGNPLSEVSVIPMGTTTGTFTDSAGYFCLNRFPKSAFISLSRTNYAEKIVSVSNSDPAANIYPLAPIIYDFGYLNLNPEKLVLFMNDSCNYIEELEHKMPENFITVESKPYYPGNNYCLAAHFANHFYPYIISKAISPFGELRLFFVIDEKGNVSNIKVDKDINDQMMKHIKVLFKTMKTWEPAILRDKNISSNGSIVLIYEE